jgi:class 3 adenylate cyclase
VIGSSLLLVDHTEKAVRAAVAMQKAFNDRNKNNELLSMVGIGISNGVLLSGYMRSGQRREITFIGECFKVAYTLSVMAGPGEILISKDVYQSIENLVSVEPLPPRVMTEKTESWENFRLRHILAGETNG